MIWFIKIYSCKSKILLHPCTVLKWSSKCVIIDPLSRKWNNLAMTKTTIHEFVPVTVLCWLYKGMNPPTKEREIIGVPTLVTERCYSSPTRLGAHPALTLRQHGKAQAETLHEPLTPFVLTWYQCELLRKPRDCSSNWEKGVKWVTRH